jgi:HK97 family phage prohead protease
MRLTGYAARFDVETKLGSFRERIRPGAFADALRRGDDVKLLLNHDPNHVIASTAAGTLRLAEDRIGLRFEADVADTTTGRDVVRLVERGDLAGCSFGWSGTEDRWSDDGRGLPLRELVRVGTERLWDVSVVAFPAYSDTAVAASGTFTPASLASVRTVGGRREVGVRWQRTRDRGWRRTILYEGEEPREAKVVRLDLARMRLELARRRIPTYAVTSR